MAGYGPGALPMRPGGFNNFHYVNTIDRKTGRETIYNLIEDMAINLNNPTFQEQALVALFKYGSRENNRSQMMDMGAGQAVLSAFNTHHTNNRVSIAACYVIRHLGGNLYAFNKAGAGVCVLRAMQDFPDDARLQSAACYAIRTLARCAYNADSLIRYGVAKLLALAMRRHPNDEDVQKAACGAVWCLCGPEDAKRTLWKDNLSYYVIQAMVNHPKAGKVQEYGIGALRGLGLAYSTVRLGGAEVCIRALQNNLANERVTEYCMRAIRDFCVLRSNVEVLVNLDAPKYIIEGLIKHRSVLRLQDQGCSAIWTMAEHEPIRNIFIKHKVGRAFLHLLQDNSREGREHTRMMITTLVLISRFATNDSSVRNFLPLGLVAVIVRSAQAQLDLPMPSLLVVERSIDVLSAFCRALPEATQPISAEVTVLLQEIEHLNGMPQENTPELDSLMRKVTEMRRLLG